MKRKGLTNAQRRELGLAVANPERGAADQALRRSGAATAHASRPHRQRSRAASKDAAIREQE